MSFFFCLKLYFLNIIFTLSLSLFMFVHFSRIRTQIIDVKRLTTRQTTTRLPLLMFVTVPICLVFLSRLSMSTSIFSFLPSIYINLSNVLFLNRSVALASVDVGSRKILKSFRFESDNFAAFKNTTNNNNKVSLLFSFGINISRSVHTTYRLTFKQQSLPRSRGPTKVKQYLLTWQ